MFGSVVLVHARRFSSGRINSTHVGFIGIGNMGSRMALNLLKKRGSTDTLFIYDKFTDNPSFSELVKLGAVAVKSPDEIAKHCSVVISMLPGPTHVSDLYLKSIFPNLTKQSLLIDCSTIDPTTIRNLHNQGKQGGHIVIDAPVSGGIKGAEAGTLTFMVGTSLSEKEFDADVKELFGPMGRPIYCGGPGVGQSVKICNNLILGAQMLGVAEGYCLAEKLGVDLVKFNEIVNNSTGQCWSSSQYNPVPGLMENVPASRDYKGGFMTDLMIKDLGLAVDAASSCGYPLPVTSFTQNIYKKASGEGYGNVDFGSIFKYLRQQTQ